MTDSRPHFKEYVLARVITLSVFLFLFFAFLLFLLMENERDAYIAIFLFALGASILVFFFYKGASRMQEELTLVNQYLSNIDKIDKIEHKIEFFTQEFEEINQNLLKILKNSKKREDTKQRYNAKLKLKNRQRADMISALSHEFRNPIASIMGYAQTLEEDKEIPPKLQERFLNKIYNNSLKIEALLSRLILWNKFESKEASFEPTTFDIYSLTQEVIANLKEKYPLRKMLLQGKNYEIKADKALLELVLKNLVENALKYSKDEVIIAIVNKRVSVIDKGEGLSSLETSKITKKFYRSKEHSWDNSMGLGLSIVKNILALHKTKLEIVSKEKKGSIFSFYI